LQQHQQALNKLPLLLRAIPKTRLALLAVKYRHFKGQQILRVAHKPYIFVILALLVIELAALQLKLVQSTEQSILGHRTAFVTTRSLNNVRPKPYQAVQSKPMAQDNTPLVVAFIHALQI